jgi:hypothetical protein
MRLAMGLAILTVASFPTVARGEFYRYIDGNGNVRFTDNLANVPPEQRTRVEEYKEAVPDRPSLKEEEAKGKGQDEGKGTEPEAAEGTAKTDTETGSAEGTAKAGPEAGSAVDEGKTEGMREDLKEEGLRLQEEYDALMEEREKLDKAASVRLTPAAQRELIDKIKDFNARIQDYEKRREAHNKAVEAYQTDTAASDLPAEGEKQP